ncbi:MAG: Disulfide bond formation protein B [Holosporales bacterium]
MYLKSAPAFFLISLCLFFGLAFALFSEHYFGVDPCAMCYTQRDLYKIACVCCLACSFFIKVFNPIKYIALVSIFITMSYSFYHVGVEQKWWPGPKTCQSTQPSIDLNNLSDEDALKQLESHLEQKKFVPCDKIAWRIMGIPATILNTVFLLFLFIIALIACFSCQKKAYKQLFCK